MTNFDLTDEEKLALAAELRRVIAEDRYPLSLRIRTLQGILDELEPRPAHEPLSPLCLVPGFADISRARPRRDGRAIRC